jgi:hypothetical protein
MKCDLCERENVLTFHHLIPTCLHTNKWFRKNYSSSELQKGINICQIDCHREIHRLIPEKELGKNYNTIDKLMEHEQVRKYINWIKKR